MEKMKKKLEKKSRKKSKNSKNDAIVYLKSVWVLVAALLGAGAIGLSLYASQTDNPRHISRFQKEGKKWQIQCSTHYKPFVRGCHLKKRKCARVIVDDFVSPGQVTQLRQLAEKGMQNRSRLGGPTILDLNTGFIKDGNGLINIYNNKHPITFTAQEYQLYKDVIEKIRQRVMMEFGLEKLFFTAPTFLTRLIGNSSWEPVDLHDEYWHLHIDKDNTPHYDFSGLLYLTDYEKDFTGGMFAFQDGAEITTVEPARGRLMMFTSGRENLHQVRKVESGSRFLMSMWFTCDESRQFVNFLDGKQHQFFQSKKRKTK